MDAEPRCSAAELATLDLSRDSDFERALECLRAEGNARNISALPDILSAAVARSWPTTSMTRQREETRNETLTVAAHDAVHRILEGEDVHRIVAIDERLRSACLYCGSEWGKRWRQFEPSQVRHASRGPHVVEVLGLLSGHPNGHVRESAVRELAMHVPRGVPWLLWRTVDWVKPVRRVASRAVELALTDENAREFLFLLPLAHRLRGHTRVDQRALLDRMDAFLRAQPDEVLLDGLRHSDARVRRATLELVRAEQRVTLRLLDVALQDKELGVRLLAARLLARRTDSELESHRLRLCHDCSGKIRAVGLEALATAHPMVATEHLESGLDDPVRQVREVAEHHLARLGHSVDLAERYRRQLLSGAWRLGAVRGLGDRGDAADWEMLVDALDERSSIARAAIQSLCRLDRKASHETRLMMVDDPRPGVSKEAARSLRWEMSEVDREAVRGYLQSPRKHVQRNALMLAAGFSGWSPGLLLLPIQERALEGPVNLILRDWLRRRWRMSPPPTTELTRDLVRLANESRLLAENSRASLLKLLRFVGSQGS